MVHIKLPFPIRLALLLLLLLTHLHPALSACPTHLHLAIGSATLLPDAPGRGITLVTLQNNTLSKLATLHQSLSGDNPTFLALSPPHVYTSNGNSTQGALRQISFLPYPPFIESRSVATDGGGVAHVSVLRTARGWTRVANAGEVVMTANFAGGSVNSFVNKGRRMKKGDVFRVPASLAARMRAPELGKIQAEPRPHMVLQYKRGVLVPDLGSDVLFYLGVSRVTGRIWEISRTLLGKGDGPRHGVVHERSGVVYVVNELSNSMVAMRETQGGKFREESRWELLEGVKVGETDVVTSAAIRVSADGRFLYTSVRIQDKVGIIVGFELNDRDGMVKRRIGRWSSGGEHPRDFFLVERVWSSGGCRSLLAVANRDSSNVVLMERNVYSGEVMGVRHQIGIMSPTSVVQY